MSKHDKAYIERFQPKAMLISDCCLSAVYPMFLQRKNAGKYKEFVFCCAACDKVCDPMTVKESETNH